MLFSLVFFCFSLVVFGLVLRLDPEKIRVRKLSSVDSVCEAVEIAAESGRPIIFCSGLTGVGPLLYAVYGVLTKVANLAKNLDVKILLPQKDPVAIALAERLLEEQVGFKSAGKGDLISIAFLSEEQFAYASGYIGLARRENVGAAILLGAFAGEALILAEVGKTQGAFQVGGSINPEQLAFFIATCDDVVLGEEIYALSGYLNKDKVLRANLLSSDILKVALLVLIIIGSLVASVAGYFDLSFSLAQLLDRQY